MKIFLKISSIILCLSIILSLPINTFADDLYFEIIEITNNGNNVQVSCQCEGTLTSDLTLICYGEDNSVLYIGEYPANNYGYFELSFPIISNSNSQSYTLSIGGNDFASPISKSFYLIDTAEPQYVIIGDGKTVAELTHILKNNNAVFFRNEIALTKDETVKTLDTISLFNGSKTVNRQAAVMGDIDLNGSVSATDALFALQHTVGKISLRGLSFKVGDISRNNTIDSECALKILHFVVGKINRL